MCLVWRVLARPRMCAEPRSGRRAGSSPSRSCCSCCTAWASRCSGCLAPSAATRPLHPPEGCDPAALAADNARASGVCLDACAPLSACGMAQSVRLRRPAACLADDACGLQAFMFLVMLLLGGFLLSVGAPGCHVRAPCPVVQCTGIVSFTVTSCGSRVTCELWLTHHANVVLLCFYCLRDSVHAMVIA